MRERTFVTGFGPFGTIAENPSAELAKNSGCPFQVLEVSYLAVEDFLAGQDPASFDRLLMIGIAAGRDRITPELFARNWIGKSKDTRGTSRFGRIDESGPLLFESTLWTPDLMPQVISFDERMKISMDAGTFLCNFISYKAMQRFPDKRVGFLHVPDVKQMALAQQHECLERILKILESGPSSAK